MFVSAVFESLEDRRLMSAVSFIPQSSASTGGRVIVAAARRRTPAPSYIGTFKGGVAVFTSLTSGRSLRDKYFSLKITAYTAPIGDGRGSITGVVTTRGGSVSFTGFTTSNGTGGFSYRRGPDETDDSINHGPDFQIYGTVSADGKTILGAATFGSDANVAVESFQLVPRI